MVPDISSIGAIVSSLNAALNIGKATMELHDISVVQTKMVELNSQILKALDGAIEAKSTHLEMLDRIRNLEQEIARLRAWDGEKERYELKDVYLGATTYALKPTDGSGEPPHWLCTTCYHDRKKSILQPDPTGQRDRTWRCPVCKSSISINFNISPSHPNPPKR